MNACVWHSFGTADSLYDDPAAYRAWVIKQARKGELDPITMFLHSSDPPARLMTEAALERHA